MSLFFESICDVGKKLRSGQLTSLGLTEQILSRIEQHNDSLNAFVTITSDLALQQARQADTELANENDRGPLHGIPIAVKDIFSTKGVRTTCGSILFESWIPDYDATVVRRLREAGAVMLGKTGMHELAYGMSGINPFFGPVSNPWAPDHDAGGSSSGSAAAVAAGLAYAALGTDTGGSIRQPAHSCGIVGLKPSFGRVSKTGVFPLAWSMDHVGPMGRSVADVEIVLRVIEGADESDPYSNFVAEPPNDRHPVRTLSELRVGRVRRHFFEGHSDVLELIATVLARLERAGVRIVERDLPDLELAAKATRTTFAEASAIHAKAFAEQPEDFGEDVRKKIGDGLELSAVAYAEAQYFRRGFTKSVEQLFADCDVLVLPTSTTTVAPILDRPDDYAHLSWKNGGIFNFTGHPAISIPCGFSPEGLPIGLTLVGPLHDDYRLLHAASLLSTLLDQRMRPPGF